MKFPLIRIISILGVLALVSLACSFNVDVPASRTGETQTFPINEDAPEDTPARVEINMGGGVLNITGGGSSLVNGSIEYNVEDWEPKIERGSDFVRVSQERGTIPFPKIGEDFINRWNLQLGDTPMILEIAAGAYEGNFNLSGVPITRLEVTGGASDSEIRFDTPNPEEMSVFNFQTGASNVKLIGIGNANFEEFTFTGGAGNYTLDFSGEFQRDATAEIDGALGNMTIIVPSDVAATVSLTGSLRNVNTEGAWNSRGDTYTTAGTGANLTIEIEMSLGNLTLVNR